MSEELNIFLKQIEGSSYAQKYCRWESYLKLQAQGDYYLQLLGIFLEEFPFNYKYWFQYIQLTNFQEYKIALSRNPKSYDLWVTYLHHCKIIYYEQQDKSTYKKQLEKAILEVGADSRALSLYEDLYELIDQKYRYQFFKKLFTRALSGLEIMYKKFQTWFDALSGAQISGIAIKQFKTAATNIDLQVQKLNLKQLIIKTYQKTLSYRDKRLKLQKQITRYYFDGSHQIQAQKQIWRELIELERENGIIENVSYLYQRSLLSQTNDVDLWHEVFHYMENQTNKYTKVLSILRNNKLFFLKFDLNIYFYWCDLEERQDAAVARRMYSEIVKINPSFEVYERMIQLEIRDRKLNNAKKIFDDVLIVFQNDIEMMCYILVQYSDFVVRYFRDLDYAKKLLKAYFDHLPFNHYLFTKYLDFMKNFENNEGFYQQLMHFITQSLTKAKNTLSEPQFINLNKIIKFYLRSTLSSIYLIKISQHKMLEVEEKLNKNH